MKRRKLRRNIRKQRRIFIFGIIFLFLFLCTGYAMFSSNISLNAKGNIKQKPISIDTLKKDVVTSGDGLYKDFYEDGRYIYRGKSPNNYIKLGSDTYRIIAIESDNTIKVVRNDAIDLAYDLANERYSTDALDYCDSTSGCNVWGSKSTVLNEFGSNVTTMVKGDSTEYNLPDTEASLNIYLNNEWFNALDTGVQNLIVSHLFNIGSSYNCDYSLTDLLSSEKKYRWKGKIALINSSDYFKASSDYEKCGTRSLNNNNMEECKNLNYLYNQNISWQFLLTIFSNYSYTVVDLNKTGGVGGNVTSNVGSLRPTFYLDSNIKLLGKGTSENPYVIKNSFK